MSSESDSSLAAGSSYGFVSQSHLPVLAVARCITVLWMASFVVVFMLCGMCTDEHCLVLQRHLTASWLSFLYTGHLATDAFMCLAGVCVGRKLVTPVRQLFVCVTYVDLSYDCGVLCRKVASH
jgi:hypothetical protein